MGDERGGPQRREGTVRKAGDFGYVFFAVRADTAAALADDGDYIPLNTDELGRLRSIVALPTIASSVKVSPTGGEQTVDASGTAQALVASSTDAQMLIVEARSGNTGAIYFGDSSVDKTSSKQVTLLQGQSVDVHADGGYKLDINEFYIDADNNDDGVDFLYL
jgi:hypothetical protein